MSQTVSQLMNPGTTLPRLVPIVQPLRVIKTPVDEVGVHAAPRFDNPNGTIGLH
jgi:hypothetical protein